MTETDNFQSGIATLSPDAESQFHSNAPWKVNGVAIPVNTVVNGGRNTNHYFPPEVLESAPEMLEGTQIVKNFHDLEGQASADQVIGKVTGAGYQKGVGLVFEGEISDREIAEKINHGYLDVSPTVARSLGEFDEAMSAQKVSQLTGFRDVAVVANGQPGAKIEMGGNPSVTALGMDALSRGFELETLQADRTPPSQAQTNAQAVLDIRDKTDAMTETGWGRAEQLASGGELSTDVIQKMAQFKRHQDNTEYENFSDIPESKKSEDAENPWWEDNGTVAWLGWGGTAGVEWAVEQSEEMSDTMQSGMEIHTPEFSGTTEAEWNEPDLEDWPEDVDLRTVANHFIISTTGFPPEDFTDLKLPVVTVDGDLSIAALRNAKARAGQVSGLSGDNLDRVISIINRLANDNFDAEFDTQSDDDPSGGEGPSSAVDEEPDTMSNDLTDEEKAVLRAADDVEDATDVLNAYATAEQPEIVESDALSAKDEQLEEFAAVFRDALQAKTGLKEDTVNAMGIDALASEFKNEDGEFEIDSLSQEPETGAGGGNTPEESGLDTLSASEKQEVKDKLRRADLLENRTPDHADTLRSEAAAMVGVDDADEIELEAL